METTKQFYLHIAIYMYPPGRGHNKKHILLKTNYYVLGSGGVSSDPPRSWPSVVPSGPPGLKIRVEKGDMPTEPLGETVV